MSEARVEPSVTDTAPLTGNRLIDAALADLAGSEQAPVGEQLTRLTAAHEVLVQVLETSRDAVQTPIPGVRHGSDGRPVPGPAR